MQLFYYKDPKGNFGDDLNPWIWNALAPEIFDDDESTVLVGIGTLINSKAPAAPRKIVFGSGVGYHALPVIDDKWKFYCVRGPRSAQRLGLDPALAISDPAVLLTQMVAPCAERGGEVCYMPHHASLRYADWRGLCEQAGLVYLDPADDIMQTVQRIQRARLVVAEAMHAAIVADAFRVPWVPVACYDHILDFKWNDWCQSLGMHYQPQRIPGIWDGKHMAAQTAPRKRVKLAAKRVLHGLGVWSGEPPPQPNRERVEAQVVASLDRIAKTAPSFLSDDGAQRDSIDRLLDRLHSLKQDCAR